MNLITEVEIASQLGITRQAVNAKLKRNGFKALRSFGRTKVYDAEMVSALFPSVSIKQK